MLLYRLIEPSICVHRFIFTVAGIDSDFGKEHTFCTNLVCELRKASENK